MHFSKVFFFFALLPLLSLVHYRLSRVRARRCLPAPSLLPVFPCSPPPPLPFRRCANVCSRPHRMYRFFFLLLIFFFAFLLLFLLPILRYTHPGIYIYTHTYMYVYIYTCITHDETAAAKRHLQCTHTCFATAAFSPRISPRICMARLPPAGFSLFVSSAHSAPIILHAMT